MLLMRGHEKPAKNWGSTQQHYHISSALPHVFFVCPCSDGWDFSFPMGKTRTPQHPQHPSEVHSPQLSSGFPLTVKDLLLSGNAEPVRLPVRQQQRGETARPYGSLRTDPVV